MLRYNMISSYGCIFYVIKQSVVKKINGSFSSLEIRDVHVVRVDATLAKSDQLIWPLKMLKIIGHGPGLIIA